MTYLYSPQGFISEQSTTMDGLGFPETRARSHKSKAKKTKNRKNVHRAKYRFNRVILSSVEYSHYFNPDPDVEARLLGLNDLVCGRVSYLIDLTVHIEGSFQNCTDFPPPSRLY
jgi:hypothetical protein